MADPPRTVCNVFWGNRLAARPHFPGNENISFSSLWPDRKTFLDMYKMCDIAEIGYDIVKLLLASRSLVQFEALISEGLIKWDHKFPGSITLAHLLCALNFEGCSQLFVTYPPDNGVWSMKDSNDREPLLLCFSPETRKVLRKNLKGLNSKQFNKSPRNNLETTMEIKRQIFTLASAPEGLYDLAILLQSYIFDVNKERDDKGNCLVHKAVEGGLSCLPHLFYLVKSHNAVVTLPNEQGLTPVCLAAKLGYEKMVDVLLCVFGAGVNSTDHSSSKWPLLHYAARYNHPELTRVILDRGGDANQEDAFGSIPSFLAQKYGYLECFHILVHHVDERNRGLAQQALEGTLSVKELSTNDINLITKDGFTLLMKAVLGNRPNTVRALVNIKECPKDFRQMKLPESNFDEHNCVGLPNVPEHSSQSLKTAVTLAAENGYSECLRILLDAGAHPAIEDNERMLPIHHAVKGNHKECIRLLVSHPKGLTGLKLASSLALSNSRTDIHLIIKEAMLRRQEEIVNPVLFEVATTGDCDLLYQLIEDSDDVNPTNEISEWPLFVAAKFGHAKIVKMLFEHGGWVVHHNSLNLSTPLHQAATGGHVEVMKFLLQFCRSPFEQTQQKTDESYLDINERNVMGATPIELATSLGHMSVVQLLLDNGAVTTLPDSNGQLLSCPSYCGIQFLLESKRKEQMDRIVKAIKEHKSLKEFMLLWKGPSDFNLRDIHGDTVLMIASKFAKPDVLEYLLQSAHHFTPDMRIKWKSPHNLASPRKPKSRQSRRTYHDFTTSVDENSFTSDTGGNYYSGRRYTIDDQTRPYSALDPRMRRRRRNDLVSSYSYQYQDEMQSSDDELSTTSGEDNNGGIYLNGGIDRRFYNTIQEVDFDNVSPHGPCTQSGVVCLVNMRDGRSALHRAVEGNQHKLIPLLLMADPKVANIQDKNGHTSLHLACQMNLKNCVNALFSCKGIPINTTLRDKSNNLAEDLAIRPNLKKKVKKYREKQLKENNPTNRPLPPAPPPQRRFIPSPFVGTPSRFQSTPQIPSYRQYYNPEQPRPHPSQQYFEPHPPQPRYVSEPHLPPLWQQAPPPRSTSQSSLTGGAIYEQLGSTHNEGPLASYGLTMEQDMRNYQLQGTPRRTERPIYRGPMLPRTNESDIELTEDVGYNSVSPPRLPPPPSHFTSSPHSGGQYASLNRHMANLRDIAIDYH